MSDLETTLRAYVEHTIERVDAEDVLGPADGHRPRPGPRSWQRPVPVIVISALVVLLAIGGVALIGLLSGDEEAPVVAEPPPVTTAPTPETTTPPATTMVATTEAPPTTAAPSTTQPAPTTTTSTTTTTIPPVTPAHLEITWQQAPTQPAFGTYDSVGSVIEGGPGLVAVGGIPDDYGYGDGAVWTSADGVTWERTAVLGGVMTALGTDRNQFIQDVAAGPAGLVAVGWVDFETGDSDPPIWVSPDGIAWERVTGNQDAFSPGVFINAVTAGGPGYVAVGEEATETEPGHAAIWVSTDGRDWARVDQPLGEGYTESSINDVARTESGIVAVGFADPDTMWGFPAARVLAWTSQDGLDWDRAELGPEAGFVSAVAGEGGATVVVGNTADDTTAWISPDGNTWTSPSPIVSLEEELWFWSVLWDGNRLLAVGAWYPEFPTGEYPFPGSHAAVAWASDDGGSTWYDVTRLTESGEGVFSSTFDQKFAGFRDVITTGERLVAVGGTGNGSAPVWIGTWGEE